MELSFLKKTRQSVIWCPQHTQRERERWGWQQPVLLLLPLGERGVRRRRHLSPPVDLAARREQLQTTVQLRRNIAKTAVSNPNLPACPPSFPSWGYALHFHRFPTTFLRLWRPDATRRDQEEMEEAVETCGASNWLRNNNMAPCHGRFPFRPSARGTSFSLLSFSLNNIHKNVPRDSTSSSSVSYAFRQSHST